MILLRHGQSEFNLHFGETRRDPGIEDPRLTELGHAQASRAAEALAGAGIRRIVASPYTRTLQTARPIAQALGVKVEVEPLVRERYAFTCDVGTPRSRLETMWPHLDFSPLDERWWPEGPEPHDGVVERATRFRDAQAALADWSATLVMCHWGFIMAMTGISVANGTWLLCDPTAPPPEAISWRV